VREIMEGGRVSRISVKAMAQGGHAIFGFDVEVFPVTRE